LGSFRNAISYYEIYREGPMKEISIHGRGGQGSLVLAQFMAIAALEDGKYGQAFPFLGGGGERRGKPIMAFCRLADSPIRLRSRVDKADYVIVQDVTILNEVDVLEGLKPGGMILVNTDRPLKDLRMGKGVKLFTFSADSLAREILGRPIMNTALLGAFAAMTRELSLNAALRAVQNKFPGALGEKNAQVVDKSYHMLAGDQA
jgi:pyruvate ferredoxin oxidoreductase gamma subunit